VVEPGDPPALAAGLRTLLEESSDELQRRGRAARRRIEENFGVRRMVESFGCLYESLLPVRPGAESDQER